MYYVYIIKSKVNSKLYVGYTDDLQRRFYEHNSGRSEYTSKFKPWVLVYYEAYQSMSDAKDREDQLKHHGKIYTHLRKRLIKSINEG